MGIQSIVNSEKGQIAISVLLGLGLASLFRKVCSEGNCIVIQGPPLEDVENKIFKQESKCYRYKAVSSKCENNQRTK
jgi:hypothetical protein